LAKPLLWHRPTELLAREFIPNELPRENGGNSVYASSINQANKYTANNIAWILLFGNNIARRNEVVLPGGLRNRHFPTISLRKVSAIGSWISWVSPVLDQQIDRIEPLSLWEGSGGKTVPRYKRKDLSRLRLRFDAVHGLKEFRAGCEVRFSSMTIRSTLMSCGDGRIVACHNPF
jgi:hypothetical protein